MFESKGALLRKVWRFTIGCLRLVSDREIYMLVWLTVRDHFARSSRQDLAPEVAPPKAKAAAATQSPSARE